MRNHSDRKRLDKFIIPICLVLLMFCSRPLLAGWESADIGNVASPGSFSTDGGTLGVSGSGADIGGTSDEFFYLYRLIQGDGGITIRILDFDGTMAWSKAGVMIRETLEPQSRYAMVVKAPNDIGNGVALQYRQDPGGDSKQQGIRNLHVTPHWLRLERQGNQFYGWHAFDQEGSPGDWVPIGPSVQVGMGANAWVGLCVTSQDDGALATAHFDRISFSGGAAQPLVGYWPLDGTADAAEGPYGQLVGSNPAFGVDGISGHGIELPDSGSGVLMPRSLAMNAEDFSIGLWYRPEASSLAGNIITLANGSETTDFPWLYQLSADAEGRLRFQIQDGEDHSLFLTAETGTGILANDEWVHLMITYDSETALPAIWANGVDKTENVTGPEDFGAPDNSRWENGFLILGGAPDRSVTGTVASMDDARIYTYPLTEIEIKAVLLEANPETPPNWPPYGRFIAPVPGQWFLPGNGLVLTAEAYEPDGGEIDRVEFYGNGNLLGIATGTDSQGNWTVSWTPEGESPFDLWLVVIGEDAQTFTSETITIDPAPELEPGTIVINEVHYDPDLENEWVEFIEIYNTSDIPVDMSNWRLTGAIEFTFPPGEVIAPDGYLVVAQNSDHLIDKYSVSPGVVVGPFEGRMANENEELELLDGAGRFVDLVDYQLGFPWPTVGDPVNEYQPGTGYSIQLMNPELDNGLGGAWRSAAPTPGGANIMVAVSNPPPFIRQVDHLPAAPMEGQPVTITAKVTDADGVASVILAYQVVEPGDYIELSDGRYQTEWTELPMNDDGLDDDLIASDDVYTVSIPGEVQTHRRLVRYKIRVADQVGHSVSVPYADDPQPNFAYFCYNGVPDWTGAVIPGSTTLVQYPGGLLESIPVYHLITKRSETENCTWFDKDGSSVYRYHGTMVYDGKVYDHIQFRARGGVWRFAMRKNMWKMHFNRGHFFQARDNYGDPYDEKWNRLNLGACIQQGDYQHRGEQGMFESVGFALFNMAGIDAPKTNFVHFRIIDEAGENGEQNVAHLPMTSSGTQYDGDFWGLYLATEQIDGRFLEEHDLPDGNLYKMEGGTGELKNLGPTGVRDRSDLNAFMSGYSARPGEDWWRTNVNLDGYYRYRSIVECIHHYDIGSGKNFYYYLNPEDLRWTQLPWDIDLTWANNMYGDGNEPFRNYGCLNQPAISVEYRNQLREIRDLLFNPDQGGQLIDEYASKIFKEGALSFVDADRAMWDYHWVMTFQAYQNGYSNVNGKAGQGRFYERSATHDFKGMLDLMKDYIVERGAWVDSNLANDPDIPRTPGIAYIGPDEYPLDALRFSISPFSDPQGPGTFDAVRWRIAEVEPFSEPSSGGGGATILVPRGSAFRYFPGTSVPSNPSDAWRKSDFDDSSWAEGNTTIGWGESGNFLATTLPGMADTHLSFFLRKSIWVDDPAEFGDLEFNVMFDDGFNIWVNDTLAVSQNMFGENIAYDQTASQYNQNEKNWFSFPASSSLLKPGENWIYVQVHNRSRNSSDCFFNMELAASQAGPDAGGEFGRPGKYEIDPVWESDDITVWSDEFIIPARGLKPGRVYRVRARVRDLSGRWSHWSEPVQFEATEGSGSPVQSGLRITELMYNPGPGVVFGGYEEDDFEFVELMNRGPAPLDIGGVALISGIQFSFPSGTMIDPGEYIVVAKNPTAFQALHSGIRVFGPYDGRLANSGESVSLEDFQTGVIEQFSYSDGRGWPLAADGSGHSLVPLEETFSNPNRSCLDYGRNWRFSTMPLGSPGGPDPLPSRGLVISEFAADTDSDIGGAASNDWIELVNQGGSSISLQGYYLSDNHEQPGKWPLPNQFLGAGGRIVFDEQTGFNANPLTGFGLSRTGEEIVLSYEETGGVWRVVDEVRFKGQLPLRTEGLYPNESHWIVPMNPTPGGRNGTLRFEVVIDEIMYHPEEVDDISLTSEFIEIWNRTAQPVELSNEFGGWRLDGGIDYHFPLGAVIPGNGRLVLVPFDPSDSAARNRFVADYALEQAEDLVLFGPYEGALSNGGERIALESPIQGSDPQDPIAWMIEDEVIYFDDSPWPASADGLGMTLQRLESAWSGNDPANWRAGEPNPGGSNGNVTPTSSSAIHIY